MRTLPSLLIGLLISGSTIVSVLAQSVAQEPQAASLISTLFPIEYTNSEHSVAPPPRGRKPVNLLKMFYNRRNIRAEARKKKVRIQDIAQPQTAMLPSMFKRQKSINARKIRPQKIVKPRPRKIAAIDDGSTLLTVFNQKDIKMKHRLIADQALRLLPEHCRNTLQNFYVRYKKPKHRGLAGESMMILDGTVPDDEFRALFIHEFGHISDLGCLKGNEASGKSAFLDGSKAIFKDDPSVSFYEISWLTGSTQRSNTNQRDFVSGYASYDAFEDFAESFVYFVLQQDAFKRRAQENRALSLKYRWIESTFFPEGISIAKGEMNKAGKVPWDITKLNYKWLPGTRIANR